MSVNKVAEWVTLNIPGRAPCRYTKDGLESAWLAVNDPATLYAEEAVSLLVRQCGWDRQRASDYVHAVTYSNWKPEV